MSKFDRCRICDYSEALGSHYAGVGRDGRKVKFQPATNDFLCDECVHVSHDAFIEMEMGDEDGGISLSPADVAK